MTEIKREPIREIKGQLKIKDFDKLVKEAEEKDRREGK